MSIHDDAGQLIVHAGSNPLSDLAAAFMQLMHPSGGGGGIGGSAAVGSGVAAAGGSNGRSDVILCDVGDAGELSHLGGRSGAAAAQHAGPSSVPIVQEPWGGSGSNGRMLGMPPIPPAGVGAAGAAALGPGGAGPAGPSFHNFVPLSGPTAAAAMPAAGAGGATASDITPPGGIAGTNGGIPGLTITEVTSPVIDMPDLDGFTLELDDNNLPSQVRSSSSSSAGIAASKWGRCSSAVQGLQPASGEMAESASTCVSVHVLGCGSCSIEALAAPLLWGI